MSQEIEAINTTVETTDDGLDFLIRQAQAMDAAHKVATALCNTQMVPQTFRGKPDDGAAAILYGAELGLKPQQALQQVFVVHGQPAIYARTMAGLLKAKGYTFTTVETSDESVTVSGTSPRGEQETATWDIARATKAGYTTNKKYSSDPQAMLYAKALSEVCRKLAPDVLLGIRYSAEELELEQSPVKMQATRTAPPVRMPETKQVEQPKPEPESEVDELSVTLARIETAQDMDDLKAIMDNAHGLLGDEDWETVRGVANAKAGEFDA